MGDLPAIEILEANHSFPGRYTFKAIGKVEKGFTARVVAAVREELANDIDPPFHILCLSIAFRPRVAVAS